MVYVYQYAVHVTFMSQCLVVALLAEIWVNVLSDKSSNANNFASRLTQYKMLRRGKKTRYKYNQRIYIRMPICWLAIVAFATNAINLTNNKRRKQAVRNMTNGYQRVLSLTSQVFRLTDNNDDDVYANTVRFDTDSYPIKIDNCCTQTMSGFKDDFIPHTLTSEDTYPQSDSTGHHGALNNKNYYHSQRYN
jgi:hypothetical protein